MSIVALPDPLPNVNSNPLLKVCELLTVISVLLGFTDVINVSISEKLKNIQKLIYSNTKKYLVEHENSLSLEEKVNLYFENIVIMSCV